MIGLRCSEVMTKRTETDLSLSLDQLQGFESGNPKDAPTPLIRDIVAARKKPIGQLANWEIGQLIVQMDGLPYILDLVMPKLRSDPLFDGGYYPGDILSNLIRADPQIWNGRPEYQHELADLYRRALLRPWTERDGFADSLGLGQNLNPN